MSRRLFTLFSRTLGTRPLVTGSTLAVGAGLWAFADQERAMAFAKAIPYYLRNFQTRFDFYANVKTATGERALDINAFVLSLLGVPKTYKSPVSGKREIAVNSARALFQALDADNDGFVDYWEFKLFMTLINSPRRHMKMLFQMYDFDDSGSVEKDEFAAVIATLLNDGTKPDGITYNHGMLAELWKGKQSLTWKQINSWLDSLSMTVDHVEFNQYDPEGTGFISNLQFKDLIGHSIQGAHLPPAVLANIEAYKAEDGQQHIPFTLWHTFSRLMNSAEEIGEAIKLFTQSGLDLTPPNFERAVHAVLGKRLDKAEVDLIYAIFDLNHDGTLEYDEFMEVMSKKRISRT